MKKEERKISDPCIDRSAEQKRIWKNRAEETPDKKFTRSGNMPATEWYKLELLAERNGTTATTEINKAVRKHVRGIK